MAAWRYEDNIRIPARPCNILYFHYTFESENFSFSFFYEKTA